MKTLMILATVSMFSFATAAAHACDGMKGHEKASDTQAAKGSDAKTKKDNVKPTPKS